MDSKVMQDSTVKKELYGLGGWLILFQISLICGICSNAYYCYFKLFDLTLLNVLPVLTLAVLIICVIFFYSKKKIFRIFYLAACIFGCAFSFINMIVNNNLIDLGEELWSLVITALMIGVVFTSKRVKNTFS